MTSPKIENGVFEPNVVKEQALKSAAMILCVDDIITAKSPKGGSARAEKNQRIATLSFKTTELKHIKAKVRLPQAY